MAGYVLFIDQLDNAINEIKLILEDQGVRVSVKPNSLQAMNNAKVDLPDVIVTEVLTQPVGGFEIAFEISRGKHGFTAPVIFYTEFYRDERTRRDITAKYGATHYFVKPFQREALRKAIMAILKESSHSLNEVKSQSGADVLREVMPLDVGQKIEKASQPPLSDSITSQHGLLGESPPVEPLPPENHLILTEPFRKELEVESNLKIAAPVIPVRANSIEIFRRSASASEKDDKAENQPPTIPEQQKRIVLVQADLGSSPKTKDTTEPVALPLRPVKKLNGVWAILALLLIITIAASFFLWYRSGRSSPILVNGTTSEANGSTSPGSPNANPTSTPAEASREGSTVFQESVAENIANIASPPPAQADILSEPSSEPVKETPSQNTTHSRKPDLAVTDISKSVRVPRLMNMKKLALSDESLRQMGGTTFVVRVVIDGKGKVREVTPLNGNPSGASLPQDLLDAIWQWEFVPVAEREGEVFFKHYSFKVAIP